MRATAVGIREDQVSGWQDVYIALEFPQPSDVTNLQLPVTMESR
jgi:hypothetical protein